ncbi:ornithine decarboxylase [Salmonella enterica subsp. arizonae]|uniref:ornithine decarboxylase n=1 Tax=Salmonella enterica subsp. arizonae TaxID=59203 RepID=A0A5Y3QCY7_SALER|nr:ornithine decarboxylase [Salmonella enterica]ECC1652991.1 ornithine decarboxylase [Salmonella enterica subsp. arizonae]ECT9555468.1 ornithine decarboxylase [Salmonella enterica subsp. arizonae serovar 41:z4,z23:-]ECU8519245.1 ornithine decarboxylase [Salmonella enterica subsp. arizonae serovar 44:z4,z23,z32:-]EDS4367785.1 ornithine decarboxylase [Salmonella enterica subsp. enterica serovar Waycross]EDY0805378.1 ornithine decarboxylase [Salmonella enterica subsp. arizonae serovar 62:z4,z23:-
MKSMNIAASGELISRLSTHRNVVALDRTDFTDVAAVVITAADSRSGILALLKRTGFNLPVFMLTDEPVSVPAGVTAIISGNAQEWLELENAACLYEEGLLPPFYDTLTQYVEMGNSTFACPGHQHGEFFRKHPAGRHFYNFFGENLFRADMCNADVKLGDLLIHEGSAKHAQKFAAKVFNADKTYFVLNGTSAANKVVTNALLTRGDLVLFDRNNHKSNHHGALIQAGATPVYLEATRNPFGFIGGIDARCFDETYLRDQIRDVVPERADAPRPFRLAIIQLGTYDGTIYNARQVVDNIGHLCDYILFDSAWVGYEQFIDMMADTSPLLLDLSENDPGIFVTQSVHKQQAGFSQTSQIHKKDNHIRGQARFCPHKRLNNAFMLHASTSPFYPLFAALDINAKIHEGESGRRLWAECVALGIDARKAILARCKMIRPFIPPAVDGKSWQAYSTAELARERRFFSFTPGEKWHGFEGYADDQYFVDPCKLLLTTPGIDAETGRYTDFGIPATILAHYLRENGIVPEKCDLNSILFLLTPAENEEKLARLVAMLAQFERHIEDDMPLADVLPTVFQKYPVRYRDYTLRELCQEMHDLYVSLDVKDLQKAMFRKESLPHMAMNPQDANRAFIRGDVELVRISEAGGRIAAEGALPYPPGVLCVVPGEIWGGAAQRYFLALEEGINLLPGFSPELQGVYSETDADGIKRLYGYVLK